ncbi:MULTISPECIES: PP2C family protein-serine/threonine phosphatase [Ramlibacter]|uniref:SpoIIE family protein phosphatase n=1 Tax=Ramlibacter pinisoli TaxID=2682844 RepID=A0A6N8IQY8_9BURK|nr:MULTISPECIES: SpoIIE family protein phosphatase [Ramlibacter]MBA2964363.1 SpoIIE family protein phosphatase [Ramlibacter sp. CGMCC 1.13660]MVQ29329.1 SpoIIE family protein phosphatase [Ramlibacter pinisoli]
MSDAERTMRILVVDDLEINRDLLVRRVSRLGHEARTAVDGVAALELLGAQAWDLVLLDITMPGMDGYETLRRIKADPAIADTPVIMVSAIDQIDSVVRCLELGADDYLVKPFNPVLLQARIESSLAKKRLADHRRARYDALSRELAIGRRIQRGFLPQALPRPSGWELAACCVPARQVSGDFYDVFELPSGALALVLADVCDKGVGAALYMALFRTLLRAMSTHGAPDEAPAATLARAVGFVNDYSVSVHGHENMFSTLFFALLRLDDGSLHYLNAGHESPLLVGSAGTSRLEPTGPAVGLVEGQRWAIGTATLEPGARLLAYTDGVTEAMGLHGAFGEPALLASVAEPFDAPGGLIRRLQERVAQHVGTLEPHDDITLLCVARAGAGGP